MTAGLSSVGLCAALAVAAVGCTASGSGTGDSPGKFRGQQQLVANTVEDLQSAGSKGDQDEICANLLARDLVARLTTQGGCRRAVDAALKDGDTFDLTVASLRVTGSTATARVRADAGKRDRTSTFRLVKQDGRWKIASLG
jgi:Putative lumazine-binding